MAAAINFFALALGPHPQRVLTLMLSRCALTRLRVSMAAGATEKRF